MGDKARFWLWVALLAVTCMFLGAVASSVVRADRWHDGCHGSVGGGWHAGSR
jgi:hypothetical protein